MTVNGREPDAKGDVVVDPPDLTELEGRIDGLADAVDEENQRAVGAEEELGRRIAAEESRAQSVERGLRDDVSSAQTAIADRYTKRETDEKIAAATPSDYDSVKGRVAAVEAKVPAQASAQNQLADKAFVNSSVATNTANYVYKTVGGRHVPFDSLAELQGYAGALTNNDYAFVVGADAAGNTTYTRYKWHGSTEEWAEEYVLNNSSFTAEQWATISSGITSGLVAKLGALPTAEALAQALAGKQDRLTFETSVTRNSDNPVKSSGIWSAIWGALSALPTGFASLYDWCVSQLAGKASTADVTLTPIYSDTPTFSKWTFSDVSDGITDIQQPTFIPSPGGESRWEIAFSYDGQVRPVETFVTDKDATNLTFEYLNLHITATRTRTDIIGYRLGSDSATNPNRDRPLASEAEAEALRTEVAGKANRAANPTAGNLAALDAQGNPMDAGYRLDVRNGIPCIIQTVAD